MTFTDKEKFVAFADILVDECQLDFYESDERIGNETASTLNTMEVDNIPLPLTYFFIKGKKRCGRLVRS